MTEPVATGGQAEIADSAGTTAAAPEGTQGQSVTPSQTTASGPDQGDVESFFDPKSIQGKPELEAAYKQMQSAFTKRMTALKSHQAKVEAYDRFERDPIGTMQQLAQMYGFQMIQRGGKEEPPKDWNPQSWDDVMAEAEKRVLQKMDPVFQELNQVKQQSMEARLDSQYPDWRTYEDAMVENLKAHPSLAKDPDLLYRMSVPAEVLEARAVKVAMEKLRNGSQNAQVSGGSTTTKQSTQRPSGKMTVNEAAEFARQQLAKQGLSRPAGF